MRFADNPGVDRQTHLKMATLAEDSQDLSAVALQVRYSLVTRDLLRSGGYTLLQLFKPVLDDDNLCGGRGLFGFLDH